MRPFRGGAAAAEPSAAALQDRRQALNDEAYKSVLSVLFAKNQGSKAMILMGKLRAQLNITNEKHKAWLQELSAAKQAGTLPSLLATGPQGPQVAGHQQQQQHYQQPQQQHHQHHPQQQQQPQRAAPVAKARSAGPKRHKRTVVTADTDTNSDNTVSAGSAQQAYPPQRGWQQGGSTGAKGATSQQHAADVDIPPLLGFKVQRYWPAEGKWFEGIITDRRAKDGFYCITYQLGKGGETHEWFDIESAASVGNPQISHYQLTPEKIDLKRYSHTRAFQNSSYGAVLTGSG